MTVSACRVPCVLASALIGVLCTAAPAVAQYVQERTVERKVVLGGVDAADWQAFSREPQLLALPGGNVAILAPDRAGVIIVNSNGQLERRVGRSGQGPGEFQIVSGFGMVADTLWLRNWPDPRISQFDSDGTHLRTWRSPVQYEERFTAPQGITGLLQHGYRYATPDGALVEKPARSPVPVLLFRPDGERVDTILTRPGYDGLVVERIGVFWIRPFPQPPLMAPLPDGAGLLIARWAEGRDVSFTRVDHTGREVLRFSHSIARVAVPRRHVEALVDSGVALAQQPYDWARQRGQPVPSDLRAAVEEGLSAPRTFPPIMDLFVAQDGNTWVQLTGDGDGEDWLVLAPTGEMLWQVSAPSGVRFRTASGSSVWGTWIGEFDVPYVARFDVVPGSR